MNKNLESWMIPAFELLKHAEDHRVIGETFDRKMALISYDNAVEVSIHRFANEIEKEILESLLAPKEIKDFSRYFGTKIKFFERYVTKNLKLPMAVDFEDVMDIHTWRNSIYHQGKKEDIRVPEIGDLLNARKNTSWILSTLFRVDVEVFLPSVINYSNLLRLAEKSAKDENSDWNRLLDFRKKFIELLKSIGVDEKNAQQLSFDQIIAILEKQAIEIPGNIRNQIFLARDYREKLLLDIPLTADENKKLRQGLEQASNYLEQKMHSFQKEIAKKAYDWVLHEIKHKTGRLGIVQQAIGSGRSIVMVDFLVKFLKNSSMDLYKIIVLFNRLVLKQQLRYSLGAAMGEMPPYVADPENGEHLESLLQDPNINLIFTTTQMLSQLNSHRIDESRLVFVMDHLDDGYYRSVKERFPLATYISFVSAIVYRDGDLIANHGFRQAVEDTLSQNP